VTCNGPTRVIRKSSGFLRVLAQHYFSLSLCMRENGEWASGLMAWKCPRGSVMPYLSRLMSCNIASHSFIRNGFWLRSISCYEFSPQVGFQSDCYAINSDASVGICICICICISLETSSYNGVMHTNVLVIYTLAIWSQGMVLDWVSKQALQQPCLRAGLMLANELPRIAPHLPPAE